MIVWHVQDSEYKTIWGIEYHGELLKYYVFGDIVEVRRVFEKCQADLGLDEFDFVKICKVLTKNWKAVEDAFDEEKYYSR